MGNLNFHVREPDNSNPYEIFVGSPVRTYRRGGTSVINEPAPFQPRVMAPSQAQIATLQNSNGDDAEGAFIKGIREGFIRGDLRQNPVSGLLEHRDQVPDPNSIGGKIDVWRPANEQMQTYFSKDYTKATGLPDTMGYKKRIFDTVPVQHRNKFLQDYQKHIDSGMDEKAALENALRSVPEQYNPLKEHRFDGITPSPFYAEQIATDRILKANPHLRPEQAQVLARQQIRSATKSATSTAPKIATLQPSNPIDYDQETSQWAAQAPPDLGRFFNSIPERVSPAIENVENAITQGYRPLRNLGSSLYNLPSLAIKAVTGNPNAGYKLSPPVTAEELNQSMIQDNNRGALARWLVPSRP